MNISLLNKPFDMEMKEVKVPKIGATDVLVKVMAVGYGSTYDDEHGRVGDSMLKPILG